MSGAPLEKPELRTVLRQIAEEVETAITPDHIKGVDKISIEDFVSQYGSLAQACIEAGCNYKVENPGPDIYAAGQPDTNQRKRLINDIERIATIIGHEPTQQKFEIYGRSHTQDPAEIFGSWEATVLEAGIDPDRIPNYIPPTTLRDELRNIATQLGAPPSREFAVSRSDLNLEACLNRYPSWDQTLRSAGLDPTEVNRKQEKLFELESLARELDHRPTEDEVKKYRNLTWREFGSLDAALDQTGAPESRDLTPADSLTKNPDYDAAIPSHTDLLKELFDIKRRSARDLDDPDERRKAFEKRAVLDESHFRVQFGSLESAFDYADSIDPRQYREYKRKSPMEETPPALLAEYARELADIMERRPLVDEVVSLTDATVDSYLDAFESWEDVFTTEFDIVNQSDESPSTPATQDLLDDLEAVGAKVEQPPTVSQYRDLGQFPVETCLRRFGSWPATLQAVGVDITGGIPQEYYATDLTKDTIQRATVLVANGLDAHQVLVDDLHRIAIDLGRQPTWDDVGTYGRFEPARYQEAINDIEAVIDDPPPVERGQSDETQALDDRLIEELQAVESLFEGYLWPRDLTLFGTFTVPTYIGTFGSLAAALEAAEIERAHLPESVSSWNAAWSDTFPAARAFLDRIQEVGESIGRAPTMSEMREAGHNPQDVYEYYDKWAEAIAHAGFDPDSRQLSTKRTRDELIAILEEMADELGRPPTTKDIQDRPGLGLNGFYTHWDTWDDALQAADLDADDQVEIDSQITLSAYGEEDSTERTDILGDIVDDIESTFE
jgi:hypothetical protein